MKFVNEVIVFDDEYDYTYNILNEIGLSVDSSGYITDQDSGIMLSFSGKRIKVTIDPKHPKCAGQGEIVLDIIHNTRHAHTLLGYAMDKETYYGNIDIITHYIDTNSDKLTSLVIRLANGDTLSSRFYKAKPLKFAEALFLIYGYNVDLSNFDISEEE